MSHATTRLRPPPPATKPDEFGSYDGSKLFFVGVDLNSATCQRNLAVAREFCRAEADNDIDDVFALMDPLAHYGTFWGIVRGKTSIAVGMAAERRHRIVFTTPLRAVTNNIFERDGYVQRGDAVSPLSKFIHQMKRIPLKESIVFGETGKIVFRQLHLKATMYW